jgi:protein-disulfide isomerase
MSATAPRPTRDERRRAARAQREAAERALILRSRRTRRLRQLAGAVVAAAALVGAAIAISSSYGTSASATAAPPAARTASVNRLLAGIPQHGTTLGSPSAPVTLVEYADLKCPICRQFSAGVLPTLIRDEVRAGKLKIEYRPQHFVGEQLNPGDSLAAARFAEAAGVQNRLWSFVEQFYANQRDESTRYVSDAYLRSIAATVPGLDAQRALTDRSGAAVTRALQRSGAEFSAHGFTGTPSFLLGRTGGSLQPLDVPLEAAAFTARIDALAAR